MVFNTIQEIIAEVMDLECDEISRESFLIRDLGVESIDLMEVAVMLNSRFNINVEDDKVFLTNLRSHIKSSDDGAHLICKYPFLSKERIEKILEEVHRGPVLTAGDIEAYVLYQAGGL